MSSSGCGLGTVNSRLRLSFFHVGLGSMNNIIDTDEKLNAIAALEEETGSLGVCFSHASDIPGLEAGNALGQEETIQLVHDIMSANRDELKIECEELLPAAPE